MAGMLLGVGLPVPEEVKADAGSSTFTASFTQGLDSSNGLFQASGSAYIEPGLGIRVNESGINLLANPSFEAGIFSWEPTGNASVSIYSGDAYSGVGYLQVASGASGDGVKTGTLSGGIAPDDLEAGAAYSFTAYVKSPAGQAGNLWLALDGAASGATTAGPFTAGADWQRISVTKILGTDDTRLEAWIYTTGGTAETLLVDAIQLEKKSWVTPYFDGNHSGCTWTGQAHLSKSVREGGSAWITPPAVNLDPSQPFWFAIEIAFGFNRGDSFGTYPVGTKDFLNIGVLRDDGLGMVGNEGIILDYYSQSGELRFFKLGSKGNVAYPMPLFKAGDNMQVVCSYDPAVGMEMWTRVGNNSAVKKSNYGAGARLPATIGADYRLSISDSLAWIAYGDYQSNSLHRNLVLKQGVLTSDMKNAYLSDPEQFLQSCGVKPLLSLSSAGVRWASFADYEQGLLSVDFELANLGAGDVVNLKAMGSITTNGAIMATEVPMALQSLSGAVQSTQFTLQYQVPPGVNSFKSRLFFTADDVCGNTYHFPVPLPA